MTINKKFPFLFILSIFLLVFIYQFSFLIPFTNNAFVMGNIRPVAADVTGYITDIYVKNEQYVKKGAPLFTVFKKPYELAYEKAKHDVEEAKAREVVYRKQLEETRLLAKAQKEMYEKVRYEYVHNKSALGDHAVPAIKVNDRLKEQNAAFNTFKALEKKVEVIKQKIVAQEKKILALTSVMQNAKVYLDETTVYASANGSIQDLFVGEGYPIIRNKPIFAFDETDERFIQANFVETDLTLVQPGDKVYIFPRIYLWQKIYHGVIVSKNWGVSRLNRDGDYYLEKISNTVNNWFILPQRLPVQIKIVDYDREHYPLGVGESAYIYISVNHHHSKKNKAA